jgi:hypothetical protein
MKIYKIAQSPNPTKTKIKVYHITTADNAKGILENGFNPRNNRMFFTAEKDLKKWFNQLKAERNILPVVIEFTIDQEFFSNNFIDRSQEGYKEVYYQDMPPEEWSEETGWSANYTKPILKNGVNCSMRILKGEEVRKLLS